MCHDDLKNACALASPQGNRGSLVSHDVIAVLLDTMSVVNLFILQNTAREACLILRFVASRTLFPMRSFNELKNETLNVDSLQLK